MCLFGSGYEAPTGTMIEVCYVEVSLENKVTTIVPGGIQQLNKEFVVLFEVPSDLPPTRACDRSIPLVLGAAPV